MIEQDRQKFTQIMLGVAENFSAKITEEGINLRFQVLKEFSLDQVIVAAKKILFTRKYTTMPTIADFAEALQPSMSVNGVLAWEQVMKHLESGTRSKDAAINRAVKALGGWRYLEEQDFEALKWIEKRFLEYSASFAEREPFEQIEGGKVARLTLATKDDKAISPVAEIKQMAGMVGKAFCTKL